ncbi:MAG: alpha/beta fold hydrolase [Actinobacteria bacterium]|nr:alpha/beta fold hydrolase [Actinomycetota bacterium]
MGCLGLLAALAALAVAAVSWVFSSSLLDVDASLGPFGTEVERVEAREEADPPRDVVTFEANPGSGRPGVYGLDFSGGHAIAGAVAGRSADGVARAVSHIDGELDRGTRVAFAATVWESDPLHARGIPFSEISYDSQLGPMPAWRTEGRPRSGAGARTAVPARTWAIFVHGHNATRAAGLRILRPLDRAGLPTLLISYRNDPGAPPAEDGLLHLGATEWKDLDAAARYALEHGARKLVLVGSSMGGAIVSQFIHRSPRAARVSALILDAPVLDWKAVMDLQASERGLPEALATTTEWVVSARIDFDWDAFDQIARAEDFTMPILLFHGTEDTTVPISSSEEFAAELPRTVSFYRVPGAGHVEAWNVDPPLFDRRVRDFLERVPGGG